MTRISSEQIREILENGAFEIRISRHIADEDVYTVKAVNEERVVFDQDSGYDIGELINELHARL